MLAIAAIRNTHLGALQEAAMSNADQLETWLWLLLVLGLGAAIGLERERRGHEAGIRTTALVCVGAALFGQVSLASGDSRVAAAVVQGIGFIGAGVMFQRGDRAKGVTTAATVWAAAGVGLLVAYELWLTAALVTATIIVLLELAPVSERIFRRGRDAAIDQDSWQYGLEDPESESER